MSHQNRRRRSLEQEDYVSEESASDDDDEYEEGDEDYWESVLRHAKFLGMDTERDADYLWLAEEALNANLPDGWVSGEGEGEYEGLVYYYQESTGISSWDHPLDEEYRQRFKQLKEKGRGRRRSPKGARGLVSGAAEAESSSSSSEEEAEEGEEEERGGGNARTSSRIREQSVDSDSMSEAASEGNRAENAGDLVQRFSVDDEDTVEDRTSGNEGDRRQEERARGMSENVSSSGSSSSASPEQSPRWMGGDSPPRKEEARSHHKEVSEEADGKRHAEEVRELRAQLREHEEVRLALEGEKTALEGEKMALARREELLKKQLQESEKQLGLSLVASNEAKGRIEAAEERAAKAEDEVKQLKAQVAAERADAAAGAEAESVKQQQLRSRIRALEEAMEHPGDASAAYGSASAPANGGVEKLQQALEAEQSRVATLEKELAATHGSAAEAEALRRVQAEKSKAETDRLEKKVAELTTKQVRAAQGGALTHRGADEAELVQELAHVSAEKSTAEAALAQASHELRSLNNEVYRLRAECAASERERSALKSELGRHHSLEGLNGDQSRSLKVQLETQKAEHDARVAELRRRVNEVEGSNANLRREMGAVTEANQERIREAEGATAAATYERKRAAERAGAAEGWRQQESERANRAEAAMQEAQSTVSELKVNVARLEGLRESLAAPLREETKALRSQLEAARSREEDLRLELLHLEQQHKAEMGMMRAEVAEKLPALAEAAVKHAREQWGAGSDDAAIALKMDAERRAEEAAMQVAALKSALAETEAARAAGSASATQSAELVADNMRLQAELAQLQQQQQHYPAAPPPSAASPAQAFSKQWEDPQQGAMLDALHRQLTSVHEQAQYLITQTLNTPARSVQLHLHGLIDPDQDERQDLEMQRLLVQAGLQKRESDHRVSTWDTDGAMPLNKQNRAVDVDDGLLDIADGGFHTGIWRRKYQQ
ncbi:unnamed protein product [Chrysoparadoxa australica]